MSRFAIYKKLNPDFYNFFVKEGNPTPVYSDNKLGELVLDTIIEENGLNFPIFGVVGAALYTFDVILQNYNDQGKIKYIHASNESTGCYMAAYLGDVLGKVGISLTTAGPGTAMAVTAISSIYNEEKPLVCFCGVPTSDFQYISPSLMNPITKAVYYIDNKTPNANSILKNAFQIAKNGTNSNPGPGPVVIFMRVDMWDGIYQMKTVVPYQYNRPNLNTILRNILTSDFKNKKVILRVGSRVNSESSQKLANLTVSNPNLYMHLTLTSKNLINIENYPNVGIEGPLGNSIVNDNYPMADIIIELGIGIAYTLLTYYDITKIGDRPLKSSVKIYSVFDEEPSHPPPSGDNRTNFYSDVDYFIDSFVSKINYSSSISWENTEVAKLSSQSNILEEYKNQKNTSIHTTASIVAHILSTIYSLNNPNYISDNHLYTCDVGAAAFVAQQLIYHTKPGHLLEFDQYSPIGCSAACAAGSMLSGEYEDLVLFMGDGGFLNVSGYIIDLINVLKMMNKRALLVLLNDKHYSNVTLGEISLFGHQTIVTSTLPIQVNINMFNLINSLVGGSIQNIQLNNLTVIPSSLGDFVKSWYQKDSGFTSSGVYIIYYETGIIPNFIHV